MRGEGRGESESIKISRGFIQEKAHELAISCPSSTGACSLTLTELTAVRTTRGLSALIKTAEVGSLLNGTVEPYPNTNDRSSTAAACSIGRKRGGGSGIDEEVVEGFETRGVCSVVSSRKSEDDAEVADVLYGLASSVFGGVDMKLEMTS